MPEVDLAQQTLKDPYIFYFLTLGPEVRESLFAAPGALQAASSRAGMRERTAAEALAALRFSQPKVEGWRSLPALPEPLR